MLDVPPGLHEERWSVHLMKQNRTSPQEAGQMRSTKQKTKYKHPSFQSFQLWSKSGALISWPRFHVTTTPHLLTGGASKWKSCIRKAFGQLSIFLGCSQQIIVAPRTQKTQHPKTTKTNKNELAITVHRFRKLRTRWSWHSSPLPLQKSIKQSYKNALMQSKHFWHQGRTAQAGVNQPRGVRTPEGGPAKWECERNCHLLLLLFFFWTAYHFLFDPLTQRGKVERGQDGRTTDGDDAQAACQKQGAFVKNQAFAYPLKLSCLECLG